MGRKRLLIAILSVVFLGAGSLVAYASFWGEENIPLYKSLAQLISINGKQAMILAETRERVQLAHDTYEDLQEAKALVESVSSINAERFMDGFGTSLEDSFPDMGRAVSRTGATGLGNWRNSGMRAPNRAYDLVGEVFGEVSDDLIRAREGGFVKLTDLTLHRYEAAAALSASAQAEKFLEKAEKDIAALVDALAGATEEEAVVIQAKIQALSAAQNSHLVRLLSRSVRHTGIRDARAYRAATDGLETTLKLDKGAREFTSFVKQQIKPLNFKPAWEL